MKNALWRKHKIIANDTINFHIKCCNKFKKRHLWNGEDTEKFIKIFQHDIHKYEKHSKSQQFINCKFLNNRHKNETRYLNTIKNLETEKQKLIQKLNCYDNLCEKIRSKWSKKDSTQRNKIQNDVNEHNQYFQQQFKNLDKLHDNVVKLMTLENPKQNIHLLTINGSISNKYSNNINFDLITNRDCYTYTGLSKTDIIKHAEMCSLLPVDIFFIRVKIRHYLSFNFQEMLFGVSSSSLKSNWKDRLPIYNQKYAKKFLINVRFAQQYWNRSKIKQSTPDFVYILREVSRNQDIIILNQDGTYQYIMTPQTDHNIRKALKSGHKQRHLVKVHIIATTSGHPIHILSTYSDGNHSDGKIFETIFDEHYIDQCLKQFEEEIKENPNNLIIPKSVLLLKPKNSKIDCKNIRCSEKIEEDRSIKCSKCNTAKYCSQICLKSDASEHMALCKIQIKQSKLLTRLERDTDLFQSFQNLEQLLECKQMQSLCHRTDHFVSDNGYIGNDIRLKRPCKPPDQKDTVSRGSPIQSTWKRGLSAIRQVQERINKWCKNNKMLSSVIDIHDIYRVNWVWQIVAADLNYLQKDLMRDTEESTLLSKKILGLQGINYIPAQCYTPSNPNFLGSSSTSNKTNRSTQKIKKRRSNNKQKQLKQKKETVNANLLLHTENSDDNNDDDDDSEQESSEWSSAENSDDNNDDDDDSEQDPEIFQQLMEEREKRYQTLRNGQQRKAKQQQYYMNQNDNNHNKNHNQNNEHSMVDSDDADADDEDSENADADDDEDSIMDLHEEPDWDEANPEFVRKYTLPESYHRDFVLRAEGGLNVVWQWLQNPINNEGIFQHIKKYFTWKNLYNFIGKKFFHKVGIYYLKRMNKQNYHQSRNPQQEKPFSIWQHKNHKNILYFRNVRSKHKSSNKYQVVVSLEELQHWAKAIKLYSIEHYHSRSTLIHEIQQNNNNICNLEKKNKKQLITLLIKLQNLSLNEAQNHWYRWLNATNGGTEPHKAKVSEFLSAIHFNKFKLLKARQKKELEEKNQKYVMYDGWNLSLLNKYELTEWMKQHDFFKDENIKQMIDKLRKEQDKNKVNWDKDLHWHSLSKKELLKICKQQIKIKNIEKKKDNHIPTIFQTNDKNLIKFWGIKYGFLKLWWYQIFNGDEHEEYEMNFFKNYKPDTLCSYCGACIEDFEMCEMEDDEDIEERIFCDIHCKMHYQRLRDDKKPLIDVICLTSKSDIQIISDKLQKLPHWPAFIPISNSSQYIDETIERKQIIDTIWHYFTYTKSLLKTFRIFSNKLELRVDEFQYKSNLNKYRNIQNLCNTYNKDWIDLIAHLYKESDYDEHLKYLYQYTQIKKDKYWHDVNWDIWQTPLSRIQVFCSCRSGEQIPSCCAHATAVLWLLYYSIYGNINEELFVRKGNDLKISQQLPDLVCYANYRLEIKNYKIKHGFKHLRGVCVCKKVTNEQIIECSGCCRGYHPSCLKLKWEDIHQSNIPRIQEYWHCPHCNPGQVLMANATTTQIWYRRDNGSRIDRI